MLCDLAQGWNWGCNHRHRYLRPRTLKTTPPAVNQNARRNSRLLRNYPPVAADLAITGRTDERRARFPHLRPIGAEAKVVASFEPRPRIMVIIAADMAAAISPYSTAVAPLSSQANRASSAFMIRNSARTRYGGVNHRRASIWLRSSLKLNAIRFFSPPRTNFRRTL